MHLNIMIIIYIYKVKLLRVYIICTIILYIAHVQILSTEHGLLSQYIA